MIKKFALINSFILLSIFLFGQIGQNKIKRADDFFNNFDFLKAISKYERVVKRDSTNTYAMNQIASAYRMIGKDQKSSEWLELVLEKEPTNLESRFYYAYSKLSKGEYAAAMDQFTIYYSLDTTNRRVNEYMAMPDFESQLIKDSSNYILNTMSINSEKSEYGPAVFKNYLLFTSSRDREVAIKRKNTWSNDPFQDIYKAEIFSDGTIGDAEIIGDPITTKFHEGSATYDAMTDQLFFTRTGFYDNELSTDDQGITNIEIFSSRYDYDNDKWEDIVPFPFNNNQYSIAQPSISADGKTLYFVSDMPGGLGGTDIYACFWNGSTWTEPKNVGSPINTEGHEKNPYIDKDGVLYFASKGHVGLGGLDIYYAEPNDKGFEAPVNMGYPVNTQFDDFSFTFTDDTKTAFYISSNRIGGLGDDDLYRIEIKPEEPILLSGTVVIKESLKDIPIKMLITDEDGNLLASDTLTESSPFELPIFEKEKPWNMVFYPLFEMNALKSKQGIDPANASNGVLNVGEIVLGEDLPDEEPDVEGALVMADDGQDPTKDTDSGEVEYIDMPNIEQGIDMQFDPVYFGFDKSNLSDQARSQLDELVSLMQSDPDANVEITGHTDSRGSKTYNLRLSERRSMSALNYLISQGIDANRITTVNHGEVQLVNQCDDGVECSKEEHAMNRRIELKVNKPSNL